MGGGVAGGSCSLNGSTVFLYQSGCVSLCVVHTKDLCCAADCPDYRITAVVDCSTPLSQAKAPILFLALGIYIIHILPAAKIKKYILI